MNFGKFYEHTLGPDLAEHILPLRPDRPHGGEVKSLCRHRDRTGSWRQFFSPHVSRFVCFSDPSGANSSSEGLESRAPVAPLRPRSRYEKGGERDSPPLGSR